MTGAKERLELAKQGFWKSKDSRVVKLTEMDDSWFYRLIFRLDVWRAGNQPAKREYEAVLAIFKAEADRRGMRHPVFYPPDQRCECGKKGLYRVGSKFFCSQHKDRAVSIRKTIVTKRDQKSGIMEAYRKEQDDRALSAKSKRTMRINK